MKARALVLLAVTTLGVVGCYSSRTPPSGRFELDGSLRFDAGTRFDAGAPVDAGTPVDAGAPVDAAGVDTGPRSPFTGSYEGTYMGAESGTVFLEIRADGSLTIEIRGPRGVDRHEGSIRVDGALNAAGMIGELRVRFTGRFTGEPGAYRGTGEWHLEGSALMGTWELHQVA